MKKEIELAFTISFLNMPAFFKFATQKSPLFRKRKNLLKNYSPFVTQKEKQLHSLFFAISYDNKNCHERQNSLILKVKK